MSVPDQKVVDRRTQVSPDEGVTVQMVLQEQKPHFEQQATVLQLRNSSKAECQPRLPPSDCELELDISDVCLSHGHRLGVSSS